MFGGDSMPVSKHSDVTLDEVQNLGFLSRGKVQSTSSGSALIACGFDLRLARLGRRAKSRKNLLAAVLELPFIQASKRAEMLDVFWPDMGQIHENRIVSHPAPGQVQLAPPLLPPFHELDQS